MTLKEKLQDIYNRLDAACEAEGDWHSLVENYDNVIASVLSDLWVMINEEN